MSPTAVRTEYAGTHHREPPSGGAVSDGSTARLTDTRIAKTAGAAISQNITPQTSQPQTTPALVKLYSRKFQPSSPKSSAHIRMSRLGALMEMEAIDPKIAVSSRMGIATGSSQVPSGQGCALT